MTTDEEILCPLCGKELAVDTDVTYSGKETKAKVYGCLNDDCFLSRQDSLNYIDLRKLRSQMEKQKKLAREDEQNKIFNAVDTSKYYIVFDDAWEKFKKEYRKALQAEGDLSE